MANDTSSSCSPTLTPLCAVALRPLLDAEPGMEVVAEAGHVPTRGGWRGPTAPRVVVLDLNMPGGSSLETITELRTSTPETAIVVLTMQDAPAVRMANGSDRTFHATQEPGVSGVTQPERGRQQGDLVFELTVRGESHRLVAGAPLAVRRG